MKTPKDYNDLIKQGKINENIVGEVLYSINKRAKNWRDKKREYKNMRYYTKYDPYDTALENEEKYYNMKSNILSKFKPIKIHHEIKINTYHEKIYDYDEKYYEIKDEDVVRKGMYYDEIIKETVEFKVISVVSQNHLYFKYYEVGEYAFHEPIDEEDLPQYKESSIIEIKDFITKGKNINDLLSTQFCKKVYDKLMNGELEIIK